jgi:hypothetical protein
MKSLASTSVGGHPNGQISADQRVESEKENGLGALLS